MRKAFFVLTILMCLGFVNILHSHAAPNDSTWRSNLYPVDWSPGYKDSEGRFLQDFSYAGYHKGEKAIPDDIPGIFRDVTQSPYNADNTGAKDVSAEIQQAINDVGNAGGGVVYLPAGTYKVNPQRGKNYAFEINHSGVVLRGAGRDQTFIYNSQSNMRFKSIMGVKSPLRFYKSENPAASITRDIVEGTTVIPVSDVSSFNVGDWIALKSNRTSEFIIEHSMQQYWKPSPSSGMSFQRMITAIDAAANTITIDIPLRYYMKTRDNARVYILNPPLEEVGFENFSFGNRRNPKSGWDGEDYNISGTGSYETHAAGGIYFSTYVVNSWIRNVSTYKPSSNLKYHILSKGITLGVSRNITVENCYVGFPQNKRGGGNGYLIFLQNVQESLIKNCIAERGRHNIIFAQLSTSGNVVFNSTIIGGNASDFHGFLSVANLIDSTIVDNDAWKAVNRRFWSGGAGQSTTQTVFWNTKGLAYTGPWKYIIESEQHGWGYVIGTQGPAPDVSIPPGDLHGTSSTDYIEGVGISATLEPQSLYLDQLQKRLNSDEPYISLLSCSDSLDSSACTNNNKTRTLTYDQTDFCGDGICSADEDSFACPQDCAVCGDNICQGITGDDCTTCVSDCGECSAVCGNNLCESGESPATCPSDCQDTIPPRVPKDLIAALVSSTKIHLSWNASTDNVGVAGYKVYRDDVEIATIVETIYLDAGLTGSTQYSYTVLAYDAAGNISCISEAASVVTDDPPDDPIMGKNGWKLKWTDSQETKGENGRAVLAFDGKNNTCWHTEWATYPGTERDAQYPHALSVDMGAVSSISGFTYLPRQDGTYNGTVKGYAFYVSIDGKNWTKATAGSFVKSKTKKVVIFKAVNARYFKFKALSEVNGNPWASVAEIDVVYPKNEGKNVWKLMYADSQEIKGVNRPAIFAFDGKDNTFWHTEWMSHSGKENDPNYPHTLDIDMGTASVISGFTYLPRQDHNYNGTVRKYEFYVSTNGSSWTKVKAGTFAKNKSKKVVNFNAVNARYIRFKALSEVNGNPWASVAEIDVIRK
ncbi:discoidin domain-containing protein [Candidatus Omnitrophota bacterium]